MRSPIVRVYGAAVFGAVFIVWIVSLAWWLLLPDARVVPLDIPAGTAEAVARGDAVEVIPDTLELRKGDTLVVRNGDDAVHRPGTEVIPPARTVRIFVGDALLAGRTLFCSIHPSGALGVSLLARPGIMATAIPTAIAGIPVSLSVVVALLIARRLDDRPSVTPAA